jgi:transcriptional regulator with XRE-family HTH domain
MAVRKGTETISEYVQRIMREQDLTLRDVEERSRRGGAAGISRPHINKIANGELTNPSPDKLKALAKGLARPEEEVFDVVLGRNPEPDTFERRLVYEAAGAENWTDDQKRRFLQAVRAIAAGIRAERTVF